MILTVTPNTALDKILFIDEWIPGTPMRTKKIVTCVGGKGLDSSVVLSHLGVKTTGLCFVAGEVGKQLLEVVEKYGIATVPIWVNGETRIAHVISELKHHRHSHVISGELSITRDHVQQFLNQFDEFVTQAKYVICAGTIPSTISQDLYGQITQIALRQHVPILIDLSKEAILQAIPVRPTIIKINWDEFRWTFTTDAPSIKELIPAAQKIYQEYGLNALVLTLGREGILVFSPEGDFYAIAPEQIAVNAAGAGDAVSSALVWRLSEGDKWENALRWSTATSAAVVLTEGTADCRMEDILRIFPFVKIQTISSFLAV